MTAVATYCTDEDISIRSSGDFPILVPKDQRIATCTDGVFAASAGGSWSITSASVDFTAQGVSAGMVAQLSAKGSIPIGELLAIDIVAGPTLTLRRKGMLSATGQPPGPAAGLSGVSCSIQTFGPQIESASYEINRRYGVDPNIPNRRLIDMYDVRELQMACMLTVLWKAYDDQTRNAGDRTNDFTAKAKFRKAELDEVLARLNLHWKSLTAAGFAPITTTTNRVGRIAR